MFAGLHNQTPPLTMDGPLQKTSRKLTVVVTMATVTNSLICIPFFLAQGPAFKEGFVLEPFENVNIYALTVFIRLTTLGAY